MKLFTAARWAAIFAIFFIVYYIVTEGAINNSIDFKAECKKDHGHLIRYNFGKEHFGCLI